MLQSSDVSVIYLEVCQIYEKPLTEQSFSVARSLGKSNDVWSMLM
jgi:hypothetical protein